MKINIREFNKEGIIEWKNRFDLATSEKRNTFDSEFLRDPKYTFDLGLEIEMKNSSFRTRVEFIKCLTQALDLKKNRHLFHKKAFWTWIASFYFETITKQRKDGTFDVRSIQWYFAGDPGGTGRQNRHAIQFACRIYDNSPNHASVALKGAPYKTGEIYDRLGDQREFMLNRTLMSVLYQIYHNNENEARATIRRFFRVLKQLSMTLDIESMDEKQIMTLLPDDIKEHLIEQHQVTHEN